MSDLEGARGLLTPVVPFAISGDPDHLGPTHLVNGYLAALFGNGPSGEKIRQSMRGKIPLLDYVSAEILNDPTKVSALRDALRTILDPDHRVFPGGQGSTFPLCLGIALRNRSDDGFGKQLGELVRAVAADRLIDFTGQITEQVAPDALYALGKVIGKSDPAVVKPDPITAWPWVNGGGRLGKIFSHSLASLVLDSVNTCPPLTSTRMAALTRAAYLAAFLGMIRSASLIKNKPSDWNSMAPMFCLGEQPPGDPRSPQCRLTIRSFDSIVAEKAVAIETIIHDRLAPAARTVTRNMPPSERARIRVATAFPDLSESHSEQAAQIIKRYEKPEAQARALARHSYPAPFVSSAIRSTGRMIGICGPDRGTGAPRFVLETPILALIVRATADAKPTVYADWLDRVYERFGIVLGLGNSVDFRAILQDLDEPMPIERALKENHNQLRKRLIRAGLAVEYSDSETEIRASQDNY